MLIAAALLAAVSAATAIPPENLAPFLVTRPMELRETPESTGKILDTLKELNILQVSARTEGPWLQCQVGDGPTALVGWVKLAPADKENLVRDTILNTLYRRDAVRESSYPLPMKFDMVRGRVRPGFTMEQVVLAHVGAESDGRPTMVKTNESAAGVKERWFYPGQVITFTSGKVAEIETIE